MFLVDDILLSPFTALKFILEQIQTMADRELNDESLIKEQLIEIELRRELEEISEEEYREREADLFSRLRAIKARQLEELQSIHSAETSELVIDIGGSGDSFDYGPRESSDR